MEMIGRKDSYKNGRRPFCLILLRSVIDRLGWEAGSLDTSILVHAVTYLPLLSTVLYEHLHRYEKERQEKTT